MKPLAVIFASLCLATASLAAEPRPNVVYVLADQWRASATGYAGDPNVQTPNLDRLAKESLNFRNAVSVAPVCTPYRAALMTGRYPTSTGMFLNDAHLPESEVCMAEIFRAAGYATAYIGKWHLDGHGRGAYVPPERRQGWEYWKAAECDHDYNRSHYYAGDSDVKRFWEGYDAFAQTKDAEQYIRAHARGEKPFILFIAYGIPHFPHGTAPAEFQSLYPPEKIQLPPNVPPAMQPLARKEAQGYYAHCTALDRCVGELLAALGETGLAANTIFVFTSDHGEMLGSHGARPFLKQVPWSEAAQVPLLLRYPALCGPQGREVHTPLTTPDLLPTLLGLAGVEIPSTIEGEDLSPLIRAGREADGRAALYMGVAPFVPAEFAGEYRALRTRRYTYVRNLQGPWMLFDDERDPCQTDNLVEKPEHAALVRDLEERLQAQLKRIGDDFRPGPSHIEEWGYEIGPHGSVPYNDPNAKPQTPRRRAGESSPPQRPLVFAAYYVWYHGEDHPRYPWSGWTRPEAEVNPLAREAQRFGEPPLSGAARPLAGLYDSGDSAVAEWHVRLAKAAGVDAFLVSWWDTVRQRDQAFEKGILAAAEKLQFKVALFDERAQFHSNREEYEAMLSRALRKYQHSPAYLRLDGRPVVYLYQVASQPGLSVADFAAVKRSAEAEAGPVHWIVDKIAHDPKAQAAGDEDRVKIIPADWLAAPGIDSFGFYSAFSNFRAHRYEELSGKYRHLVRLAHGAGKRMLLPVHPGHDNTHFRTDGYVMPRRDGQTLRDYLRAATDAGADYILVTSWNEWPETTVVEPSSTWPDPYLYLKILAEWKGIAFTALPLPENAGQSP